MHRSVEFLKVALLIAFLAAGLLLVKADGLPFWGWCLLAGITLAMLYLPGFNPYLDELVVSEEGVIRRFGPKLRKKTVEKVDWHQLSKVEVVTNELGPFQEDMVFLLHGAGGAGIAVPGGLAAKHGLVAVLQQRLNGFRNKELIEAAGSVSPATFTLWEASVGNAG
jgi:hypothetical protein